MTFYRDWWRTVRTMLLASPGHERNRFALRRGLVQVATLGLGDLAYLGALAILGLAVLGGRATLGAFAAALKASEDVQRSVLGFMFNIGRMKQAGFFVSDVWAFLDAPGALPDLPPGPPPDRSDVAFAGVTFCYPGKAEPTIFDISAAIRSGELVALVGENGAGKSTLVKLLLGLYPPSAGSVQVGGAEISAPAGAGARAAIAPVFQEYFRYSLTAGENIAVGAISALDDRPRIEAAAAGSGADAVIAALPRGYATQLGKEFEDGQELSGAQAAWYRSIEKDGVGDEPGSDHRQSAAAGQAPGPGARPDGGPGGMKKWIVGLFMMLLAGCASTEPAEAPVSSPAAPTPARVTAIVAAGPNGEQRFTPSSNDLVLALPGPLTLRAELEGATPQTVVEWYFEGMVAQGWGEVRPESKGLRRLGEGREMQYAPGPGTRGQLWVIVWGEGLPAGRPGWRSWPIYPRIPLAVTATCPPVRMPPPPVNPGHAWRDTVVDKESNTLILNWSGSTFLVPLSADPATCADGYVAEQLRFGQQQ